MMPSRQAIRFLISALLNIGSEKIGSEKRPLRARVLNFRRVEGKVVHAA